MDECLEGLDNCQLGENCVNEPGGFSCQPQPRCPPGYRPSLLYGVDCEGKTEVDRRARLGATD